MKYKTPHPKINYWFWDEKTISHKNYLKNIDEVAENSSFDLLMMTERQSLNFWDPKFKPLFAEAVEYAHSKNLKLAIQFWPLGTRNPVYVPEDKAVALVTEYEAVLKDGKATIDAHGRNVRALDIATPIKSELIFAVSFDKITDGVYADGSVKIITDKAKITEHEDREALTVNLEIDETDGKTVYVMVAHYYSYGDLFSDFYINEFKNIMDFYKDVPFDGFAVDEFRNISLSLWTNPDNEFRERIYGKHFESYFNKVTGENLIETMFDMRWCPENKDNIRMKAINIYFDIFRHSTILVENFIADYALKTFGDDTFIGVHNTFHNALDNDEIWQTCCNWWELPRKYAQTDEDIAYPVRMGIACTCPENIIYDMFYHKDKDAFYKKAVRDARFNTRIHYHAINDGSVWGIDTGKAEFLKVTEKFESKIMLLNLFDPPLPKMELLAVFGFPALCNWYPNYNTRNRVDINNDLKIIELTKSLWNEGYLNALAPSDAIADGRISMKDGKYTYGGHSFDKLLFMYPEYSKPETIKFIKTAADNGYEIKVLGELNHNFNGEKATLGIEDAFFVSESDDIAKIMNLSKNEIPDGCITEDNSVVISNYDSVMNDSFCNYKFVLNGHKYEAEFRGTFALKESDSGNIEKLTAGNLKLLKKDGKTLISLSGENDYLRINR